MCWVCICTILPGKSTIPSAIVPQPNQLFKANYNANELPKGKHCTKCMGKVAPPAANYVTL